MSRLLIAFVCLYRLISPLKVAFFGASCRCRFSPTCSHFARHCLDRYSLGRSLWLIARRLARCNPFWHR